MNLGGEVGVGRQVLQHRRHPERMAVDQQDPASGASVPKYLRAMARVITTPSRAPAPCACRRPAPAAAGP
jgi:hypothetical protein